MTPTWLLLRRLWKGAGMLRLAWTEHNQGVVPSISFMPQFPLQTGGSSSLSWAPLNPRTRPTDYRQVSPGGKPSIPSFPTVAGIPADSSPPPSPPILFTELRIGLRISSVLQGAHPQAIPAGRKELDRSGRFLERLGVLAWPSESALLPKQGRGPTAGAATHGQGPWVEVSITPTLRMAASARPVRGHPGRGQGWRPDADSLALV